MTASWRALPIALLTIVILITLFGYSRSPSTLVDRTLDTMASPKDLRIVLSQASNNPLTIRASIHNDGKSTLTVLPWDTPVDPQAHHLGVFQITNADSGEKVQFPRIMINHKVPVDRSQLVQIEVGKEVSQEVSFEGPRSPIKKGSRYSVQAKGKWRAVWVSSADGVAEEDLGKLGAAENAMSDEDFESEAIEIQA